MSKTGIDQSAEGALVHNTKSSAVFNGVFDEKTGEIQAYTDAAECARSVDHSDKLIERYRLQRTSSHILSTRHHPRQEYWRVTGCMSRRIADLSIVQDQKTQRCSYQGLMICGSVWTCPVCAAKITERRSAEIEQATDVHFQAGGAAYFVTLTFSHGNEDCPSELVRKLRDALKRYRAHWSYKDVTSKFGLIGLIRALEVTYGHSNGFHPHVHELWLVPEPLSSRLVVKLRSQLFEVWRKSCLKAGLQAPSSKRGIDIKRSFSAAEYLQKFGSQQKWGSGAELAKGHVKVGHSRLTPWDFLRLAETDPLYAVLFHRYCLAFFGSRQLYWTNGLKSAFGITDLTDQELAAPDDTPVTRVVNIRPDQWKAVLRLPTDQRGLLLRLAETGGSSAVLTFLDGL